MGFWRSTGISLRITRASFEYGAHETDKQQLGCRGASSMICPFPNRHRDSGLMVSGNQSDGSIEWPLYRVKTPETNAPEMFSRSLAKNDAQRMSSRKQIPFSQSSMGAKHHFKQDLGTHHKPKTSPGTCPEKHIPTQHVLCNPFAGRSFLPEFVTL